MARYKWPKSKILHLKFIDEREGKTMVKIRLTALLAALSLALFVPGANAAEGVAGGLGRAFTAGEIIGVHVKNPQGEMLGRITDLVMDEQGRVALVILSHGGFLHINEKETAIPLNALRYDQPDNRIILDISREKLA
ncbi:MAG TPA: PRC-barrel domain-containing protein, partial [Thermodesulfobacteriota bacterium]|nr:PRC-barrel domain-containing protein [Thermodesulfobacteriota bacterium]